MRKRAVDIRAAARSLHARGYIPLPVPRTGRRKGCTLPGWSKMEHPDVRLDDWFPTGDTTNVGLRLGVGGLVDVDLDTPAAIIAGAILLPPTPWVGGRQSARKSHYFYTLAEGQTAESADYDDPRADGAVEKVRICELRADGRQTVVPPSLHETEERYEWATSNGECPTDPPARVEGNQIARRVRWIAAAALLSQLWPKQGARNAAALALAGTLVRGGLANRDAEDIVRAVCLAAGDDEVESRVKCVAATAEKAARGEAVTGWTSLCDILPGCTDKTARTILEWLGLDRSPAEPKADTASTPTPVREWPAPPIAEAFHGVAGDFVRALDPHTEADPVALLVQVLVQFGNVIGRTAHFVVEADKHYANEFAVLVGQSAKGRKGTSHSRVHQLLHSADAEWADSRVQSGLSSGEGLIWAVRDPIEKKSPIKERGRIVDYQDEIVDAGIEDKRLLVFEPEFANVLKQSERSGNILSTTIRQSFDTGTLRAMTKNSPAKSTGAHVSIIGHITTDELTRLLSATETANGFANRFCWFAVRRSKMLPEGGRVDPRILAPIEHRLVEAVSFARSVGELRRDDEAREIWCDAYATLSADRHGLTGSLLGRAEAHAMRFALIYALLDKSDAIRAEHLLAGIALWDYVERSVGYIFGDSLGDPLADDLLRLIRQAGASGITRSDINSYLGRNSSSERIGRALGLLLTSNRVRRQPEETGGRPAERWFALANGGKQ